MALEKNGRSVSITQGTEKSVASTGMNNDNPTRASSATEHSLEERIERHKSLLNSDDVTLFTKGGCHIFAQALHERFNYPIHYIPGFGGKGIVHIYSMPSHGFDG